MVKIIDIHCHPSMKPYNNKGFRTDGNIWLGLKANKKYFYCVPGVIRKQIQETERDSQAYLNEFTKGNVKSGFFVIHPAERGWFMRNTDSGSAFFRRLLRILLFGDRIKYLAASLTGFPKEKVDQIFENVDKGNGIDYFKKETFQEYKYIRDNEGSKGSWDFKYEIVNDYSDFQRVLANGKIIPVVITIEGGHALTHVTKGEYFRKTYDQLPPDYIKFLEKGLDENIGRIKGQKPKDANGDIIEDDEYTFNSGHIPFFVTLSHMYNNFLAGHARTYPGVVASLLDQQAALDTGITPAGWKAVNSLLEKDKSNGIRRILIDVKHLSMLARQEYYKFVKDKREGENPDPIPIICSHAATNGFMKNDTNRLDTDRLDKDTYFSRWSVNISDEDIKEIHDSDGIIGLVPHEGRMPGTRVKKKLKSLKKEIKIGNGDTYRYVKELKKTYLQLFISNIFQIVTTINSKKGWEHIGIGSDYDGIMDPFDFYKTSGTFQDLLIDIHKYLTNPSFDLIIYKNNNETRLKATEVPNYFFGYSPDELIENIGHKNVERFLSKYFTKAYLLGA